MKLQNPVNDEPTWSVIQRRMFEALIADYAQTINEPVKQVRERIKQHYNITTTYELTQYQQQEIINNLINYINETNPNYFITKYN